MERNAIGASPAGGEDTSPGPVSVPTPTPKAAEGTASERTPLMEAAESGDVEVVRSLLDSASEINVVDQHGENALMLAAAMGNGDVVRVLLVAGADVSTSTPYGWSAQKFAEELGHEEVACLLKSFSPAHEVTACDDLD